MPVACAELAGHPFKVVDVRLRSQIRNIRLASTEVMRLFLESELAQYSSHIREKQSRIAFEFCNDIEIYLKSIIKDRLKDIELKIR